MDNGPRRPPSGTQWTIDADGHEAVIVEVGGGLRGYRRRRAWTSSTGTPRTRSRPACAGQVLAPVAEPDPGRAVHASRARRYQLTLTEPARHNAIHGLVNWVPLAAGRAVRRRGHAGVRPAAADRLPVVAALRTRWSVWARRAARARTR